MLHRPHLFEAVEAIFLEILHQPSPGGPSDILATVKLCQMIIIFPMYANVTKMSQMLVIIFAHMGNILVTFCVQQLCWPMLSLKNAQS